MSGKLTFGDLKVGDKFIAFPSDGDNSGHGGYLGSHNVFMKISPCYEKSTFEIFKLKIINQPALQMNSMNVDRGILSHSPNNMFLIKVN